jgi:hypothetical protein
LHVHRKRPRHGCRHSCIPPCTTSPISPNIRSEPNIQVQTIHQQPATDNQQPLGPVSGFGFRIRIHSPIKFAIAKI